MFWDNPIHVKVDVFCSFLGACFIFTFFFSYSSSQDNRDAQRQLREIGREWTEDVYEIKRGIGLASNARSRIEEQYEIIQEEIVQTQKTDMLVFVARNTTVNSTKRNTPSSETTEAGPRVVQAERQRDDVYEIIGMGWFCITSMGIVGQQGQSTSVESSFRSSRTSCATSDTRPPVRGKKQLTYIQACAF